MYNLLWGNRKARLTTSFSIITEGAGAGGRAMMFHCSNLHAVQKLAGSAALGNDMFKTKIINPITRDLYRTAYSRTQITLVPRYAVNIHKVQNLTITTGVTVSLADKAGCFDY